MDSVRLYPQKYSYTRYSKYTSVHSFSSISAHNSPRFNKTTFLSVSSRNSLNFDKLPREENTNVYGHRQVRNQDYPEKNLISSNSLEAINRTNHFQYDCIKSQSTTSLLKNLRHVNTPTRSLKLSRFHNNTQKSQPTKLKNTKKFLFRSLSPKYLKNSEINSNKVSEVKYDRIHHKTSSKLKVMRISKYKDSEIQGVLIRGTSANFCKRNRKNKKD